VATQTLLQMPMTSRQVMAQVTSVPRHAHVTHALERGAPIHLVRGHARTGIGGHHRPLPARSADRQFGALHVVQHQPTTLLLLAGSTSRAQPPGNGVMLTVHGRNDAGVGVLATGLVGGAGGSADTVEVARGCGATGVSVGLPNPVVLAGAGIDDAVVCVAVR
jgi:hypothetical protein